MFALEYNDFNCVWIREYHDPGWDPTIYIVYTNQQLTVSKYEYKYSPITAILFIYYY